MSNILIGKLFREFNKNHEVLTEETKEGQLYIEGIFCQADIKNNNSRVYPAAVLDKAVQEFIDTKVKNHSACGEMTHPDSPRINLDRVCIKIEDMKKKGSDWYGKAKVAHEDCPCGKILRGLIKTGLKVGVSSRGLGSADKGTWKNEECNMVNNFVLRAIDVVSDPSAPDAYVDAITESKEWILDNSTGEVVEFNEENYRLFESRLTSLPKHSNNRQKIIFEGIQNFLNSLRANR